MILGDHKKRDKPHWMDYNLAIAYETIEMEKCPKCGVPIWWAYSEDNTIKFEHEHIDCESCKFDEQEKEKLRKNKQEVQGRTLFVKAVPEDGFDALPTRADFQKEMMAKTLKEKEKRERKSVQ